MDIVRIMYSDHVSTTLIQARFHALNRSLVLLGLHLRPGSPHAGHTEPIPISKQAIASGGRKNLGLVNSWRLSDSLVN